MSMIDLAGRRELFVDHYLIDSTQGSARLTMHPPKREQVVFQVAGPYENGCSGVYSVLVEHEGRYLLYYRGNYPTKSAQGDESLLQTANVAVSTDGIHFERPDLGVLDLGDGGRNNVIWQGIEGHNFVPFLDGNPKTDADKRFKAVGGTGNNNLRGMYSADGIHWRAALDKPLDVVGAFDSANRAFWDGTIGKYRLFSRNFRKIGQKTYRIIQSCVSDDFIHWSKPVEHVYDDGVPMEEFYTNATSPCPGAEHLLLSFPMRYVIERRTPVADISAMEYPGGTSNVGMTDAVMMSSRDGVHWHRPFLQAWLRPGLDERNWTHRNTCPAIGILPLREDEWSMYVSEHYGWPDNRLRRLSIRPWGFGSISGGRPGGQVLTHPLTFTGRELRINFATSAVGGVRVELQDATGKPIAGHTLDDMQPMFGDRLDQPVTWTHGADLSKLAGQPVRLRFELEDADVFALRFA